jgi:hypothetical protein
LDPVSRGADMVPTWSTAGPWVSASASLHHHSKSVILLLHRK